jgi:hypothetical protein
MEPDRADLGSRDPGPGSAAEDDPGPGVDPDLDLGSGDLAPSRAAPGSVVDPDPGRTEKDNLRLDVIDPELEVRDLGDRGRVEKEADLLGRPIHLCVFIDI